VPKPYQPPKTPRYNVRDIQSLAPKPSRVRINLAPKDVASAIPSLVAKRPELIERLAKRGVSYLREAEARRQANIVSNRAAAPGFISRLYQQYGGRDYAEGLVGFNALPGVVTGLTNRPLQTMVNYGSTGLQKLILQTLGPKLGAGAARFADTALMGGSATIPALNIGSGYLLQEAPLGAVNVPENRRSYFDTPRTTTPRPWNIGR
jgi:hypothetical protein